MPSEIVSPGTKMLRFLTPTEEWARRTGKPVSVPANWPFMLAEIFVAKDDADLDDIHGGCYEELCEGVLRSRDLPLSV